MNELYELATVVLGCVVVGQYLHIRKQSYIKQKLFFTLHQLAERKWKVEEQDGGFIVYSDDGTQVIAAKFMGE
jgi:hypothetical protein